MTNSIPDSEEGRTPLDSPTFSTIASRRRRADRPKSTRLPPPAENGAATPGEKETTEGDQSGAHTLPAPDRESALSAVRIDRPGVELDPALARAPHPSASLRTSSVNRERRRNGDGGAVQHADATLAPPCAVGHERKARTQSPSPDRQRRQPSEGRNEEVNNNKKKDKKVSRKRSRRKRSTYIYAEPRG
ncbi:hypothetical protein HPB50_018229 [Hyalomma asiaticum]|uniref:Uncharacterized protein n=1 Tax=Hyalomma asiaticum TaxID=266040 RepID=A0ACB7SP41_HYAAI|nr:hypothetical protein HPB50_018229 [Hyalomma asiaticum]